MKRDSRRAADNHHAGLVPKTVTIGGIEYRIVLLKSPLNVDPGKRESWWGGIDFWAHTIRLYRGRDGRHLTSRDLARCLFHEAVHAVLEHHKTLKHCLGEKASEEDFVDEMAVCLLELLVANPGMTKLLQGKSRHGK